MMLPFGQYVEFDQCVLATFLLVVAIGGMRLFYGAWPWEARKTWYRTRPAVDYLEALRRQIREPVPELVRNVDNTTDDSFDRSLIVKNDNLMPEVAPEPPSAAEQLREPKSKEKPSRARQRWLKSNRRKGPTHTAETAARITDAETVPVTTDAKIPMITTVEASFVPMLSANIRVSPKLDIQSH